MESPSQSLNLELCPSTTIAALKPGGQFRFCIDHFDAGLPVTRVVSSLAGSPGSKVTSKRSSGHDSPSPIALMKASLRVQQLKNASVCKLAGKARNRLTSVAEKNFSAI